MKKILLGFLLMCGFMAKAQVYNNAWIDYSKTYYKFKVGSTGLYRLPQTVLSSAGLDATPAEYFQLWRNGRQIPIYTSVSSGALGASDYIEFWGEMNDGKPDKELYRDARWQLNDKWSLETDTAAYFLTVNNDVTANRRLETTANNVAGTSLPVDQYFMYTMGKYFKDRMNPGYAVDVTEYLYSSSYDRGEGWSSAEIISRYNPDPVYGNNRLVYKNLNVYKSGPAPAPKFTIAVSGNLVNQRRYLAKLNSDSVLGNVCNYLNYALDSTAFSINSLNGVSDTVTVFNYTGCRSDSCPVIDRMVIHKYEITYPRTFNFNGQKTFEFTLAANAAGNYLQITNFSNGTAVPVLYDLTNGKRYAADLTSAPMLKFVLEPSLTDRNLVLVNEDAANVTTISALEQRNFINYTDASNQGDYLIITSPLLFAGANGTNPVEGYRAYRSSVQGGSHDARIYLADEIIDQFGFGIKKNPAAIRDFILYARDQFASRPTHVFIIGHGLTYVSQRSNESKPDIDRLNMVPTYGSPASDVLLSADKGSSLSTVPIGRLSVVSPAEVSVYLEKVKEYEQVQATPSSSISDKAWMKNVAHIVGASDENLDNTLSQYLNNYGKVIADTVFGGNVSLFRNGTADDPAQLTSTDLANLINTGTSLITYFGHSSAGTLNYNLDNPGNYNNAGKYPMFIALGCNAGDFYGYTTTRFITTQTTSETYVLAPERGSVGFVASSHFGIVHYLNVWAERAYKNIAYREYGNTIGEALRATARDVFNYSTQEDFYARCTVEELQLNGDPAVKINFSAKPDYAIEDSMVKVSPGFVSVADASFNVTVNVMNIGKAVDSTVVVEIKRELPNQSTVLVSRDTLPRLRFFGSVSVDVPIDPNADKGLNKLIVTIDPDNTIDELFENNNSVTKDVMIFEDEARPVYPYNFAIVNKQGIKLVASTANPFAVEKQYAMEIDTTELFNSPSKVSRTLTSKGGVLEFDPGIMFTDGTVYYWRVAPIVSSGSPSWNSAAFVYLPNSEPGFNQSHKYQFLKSDYLRSFYDSLTNSIEFKPVEHIFFIRNAVFPTASTQMGDVTLTLDNQTTATGGCYYDELIFNIFDPVTMKPWKNNYAGGTGLFNSLVSQCGPGREHNFEFLLGTQASRKKIIDFLDSIPDGFYVVVRSNANPNFSGNTYSNVWLQDESVFGANNSIYTRLVQQGFTDIDSINRPRSWIFIYKKNSSNEFHSKSAFSLSEFDKTALNTSAISRDTLAFIKSPLLGPATKWEQFLWDGYSLESFSTDSTEVDILGYSITGAVDTLIANIPLFRAGTDLSFIDAKKYPVLQLVMSNFDRDNLTPFQLRYWRLTGEPAPEGAVAPNVYFEMKDTVDVGQPVVFKMAFKNVSETVFADSIKVKAIITDKNNVTHVLPAWKQRPLLLNPDTLNITYPVDTRQLTGMNSMFIEVNPDNDQPEQYHFNNMFYRQFFVRPDTLNPLLDVTFDDRHILNNDIVSAKPNILIKLKDEAQWNLLVDPSKMQVQLRKFGKGTSDPGWLRDYNFNSDTLLFQPADQTPPTKNNTASAIFRPALEDGNYELIISARDMSNNTAGSLQYRVSFEVINKPMISNMLNYPNPFTTSTAFVFTLTGSEVPQNIRIQILTVTGKIVREITKEELGPMHIGRNITEFKWDGTDQYGQKLANGVYLYRVVTNLNGKSLEKYTSGSDNTDQYFNKGYGKMYLMR